eukprot:CAMPEP_0185251436 /NCGR_PEP_ID=MMETSP1359-20130426/841_1 /TAXON_ID=552665 /ORGANISM="Bigelowiella longifila, Strain CCMP242" /LENGTH=106 /DNA_ID=CAMNT_0027833343 /DNA_START=230 /DNA_END=550 /DNA_ORIENTATION=-
MMEMSSAEASLRSPSGIGRVLLSLTKRHAKLDVNDDLSSSAMTSEPGSSGVLETEKSAGFKVEASTFAQRDSIGSLEAKNINQESSISGLEPTASTVTQKNSPEEP